MFLAVCVYANGALAQDCGGLIYLPSYSSPNPSVNPDPPNNTTPNEDLFPDFITKKVTLTTPILSKEANIYGYSETVRIDSYIKNVGQADWKGSSDSMEVRFYLSNGYKEDSHSEWRKIGTEQIKKGNIDIGVTKHETHDFNLATGSAGGGHLGPGIYNIVACVDRDQDQDNGDGEVPEMHESNNCSTEAVFEVKKAPPEADFSANQTIGLAPLIVSFTDLSKWYPTAWLWNFGDGTSSTSANPSHTYTGQGSFNVTLSVQNDLGESTKVKSSYISIALPPFITVTNPTTGDNWRSTDTKHITWQANNFTILGNVKIEYTMNGGSTWKTIESTTANDGSRYWSMCKSATTDSSNSYIRITSLSYPSAVGYSQKFTIDHAKGCK